MGGCGPVEMIAIPAIVDAVWPKRCPMMRQRMVVIKRVARFDESFQTAEQPLLLGSEFDEKWYISQFSYVRDAVKYGVFQHSALNNAT